MAYLSLYRKHRPRTFDEVVGQEHVTRTLVNAITEDRLHHAYLFTGQRGTGKTSTARILAAAVNCEDGPTAEPCGTCEQCASIIAGNNVDVIELDMASHGGVDDARELRDRAVFSPASARKKVYILDEVHMASTAAFNALLKVVEEPPGHVLFAMATTDPQKVLPTIMSRVQRLDLRRVPAPVLTAHLERLGEEEGFTLDAEAAAGVVAAGDGSVRDTLSVLEQVLAFASDADARDDDDILHISGEHVTRVLGATPFELTAGVVDAIAAADIAAALTRVQELLDRGTDLRRFSLDLARHLRDLLVLAAAPNAEGLVEATAERHERLVQQAQRFGTDTLVRAVELVGEVLVEQRQGPPRLPLELAVARLATPGADGDVLALADRIARLEKALEGGGAAPAAAGTRPGPAETRSTPAEPDDDGRGAGRPADATPDAAVQTHGATDADEADEADAGSNVGSDGASESGPRDEGDEEHETTERADAGDAAPAADADPDDGIAIGQAGDATGATSADSSDETGAADAVAGDDADADADADGAGAGEKGVAAQATDVADDVAEAQSESDTTTPASADDDPRELAARAAELAASGPRDEPEPLTERPGTTTVERDVPEPAPSGGDDLERIATAWDAILENVGERSRRAKAFYEPATPVRLGNGVLLLSYPTDKRFHAEQGKSGEMTGHLAASIEQSTGLERIRVDVHLEDGAPRRPTPPAAAGGSSDSPSPAEVAAVNEVEQAAAPTEVDADEVEELLRTELGAQRLEDEG